MPPTSAPTVAGLCVRLDPQLRPAPGFVAPEVPITAVHISELLDPAAYLSGGELLLTTGLALPRSRLGCTRYVDRLLAAGVNAVALGLGPVHTELPAALVDACRDAGLCLLVVPEAVPFLAITKAYWGALSRSAERELADVLTTHQRLVDAAAGHDATPAALRTLVRAVGSWAAVLSPEGDVEEVWPRRAAGTAAALQGELERLRVAGTRSAASLLVREEQVSIQPLAVEDEVVGYLALGSDRVVGPNERRLVVTACALLSLDLVRRRSAEVGTEAVRRSVALLLDLGMPEAAVSLGARLGAPPLGPRVRLLAVDGGSAAGAATNRRLVRAWCPDVLDCPVDERRTWFVLPVDHPPEQELRRVLDPVGARMALSGTLALEDVATARAELVRRLDNAPTGQPDGVLEERLSELLHRERPELAAALVAYLRHRGQWDPAARSLGVHRNTLRSRVTRCRELLGADLDDPDVSAPLWLMLRERGC
jgi:purine catabolism regulator